MTSSPLNRSINDKTSYFYIGAWEQGDFVSVSVCLCVCLTASVWAYTWRSMLNMVRKIKNGGFLYNMSMLFTLMMYNATLKWGNNWGILLIRCMLSFIFFALNFLFLFALRCFLSFFKIKIMSFRFFHYIIL